MGMQVRLRAIIIAAQCCFIFGTNYTMDEPQKAAEPKKVKKTQTAFGAFLGTISPELGKYIDGEQPAITNNPYKDRTGIVAHNPGISKDEKVFLYYKKFAKRFVCVVVRHQNGSGFIISTYPVDKIKKGEIVYEKSKIIS